MKGYKVFYQDWTCKNFQYEVGQTYEMKEDPVCCSIGFHFCKDLKDCFNYYSFNPENKVAEVEALGQIDSSDEDSKCCTNKIKIIREMTWHEVLDLVNTGKDCTGFCNSGNRNSGDCNSGNRNSGNRNSGNRNSGDWNKTSFSSGCFNTVESKILMFNKPSEWTYSDWFNSDARYLLNQIPTDILQWVWWDSMTDEEKEQHPEYEATDGYLKMYEKTESTQMWYDGLSKKEKDIIKALPNFDADIFEQITGIRV